jgi:nitroreductase
MYVYLEVEFVMNLYEAIFVRKTVRKYKMEPLDQTLLNGVKSFAESIPMLFEGIAVEYRWMEYSDIKKYLKGSLTHKAPYYLALYSENIQGFQMNAGYLMQQVSLYLTAKGLGSCYLGMLKPKKEKIDGAKPEGTRLDYVITLAFGKAENEVYRTSEKAKRLPMNDIAIFKSEVNKNIKTIIQAARIAPSSMNSQPWRLVVYDNRIHIFCKKNIFLSGVLNEAKLVDIGICLAHMLVTAEELWVDVKTVHLDNISSIAFKKNDYVISVKVF